MTIDEIKALAEEILPYPSDSNAVLLVPPVRLVHILTLRYVYIFRVWECGEKAGTVDSVDFGHRIPADRFSWYEDGSGYRDEEYAPERLD